MGCVPEQAEQIALLERQPVTDDSVHDRCDDERADGDKDQRMRELPVIFKEQQRISGRENQDIHIRCQPAKTAHQGC